MDAEEQLHEVDARGWQRSLYDDVKETFRAPIVNWVFRTAMANEPEFLRYAWGQVKPVFETRAFARLSVRYRDAVLGELEREEPLPAYRPGDVDLGPTAYRELRGQVATYDVVAPRLAVLFETMDRALQGDPVGHEPAEDRAATAPIPDWIDRNRGRSPTLIDAEDVPEELAPTVDAIRAFHGFGEGLPSIYRTLAQWPTFLERMWTDVEPHLTSDAFGAVRERTDGIVRRSWTGRRTTHGSPPTTWRVPGSARTSSRTSRGCFDGSTPVPSRPSCHPSTSSPRRWTLRGSATRSDGAATPTAHDMSV